jgi:hypothetical protein
MAKKNAQNKLRSSGQMRRTRQKLQKYILSKRKVEAHEKRTYGQGSSHL